MTGGILEAVFTTVERRLSMSFASLDALCDDLDADQKQIIQALAGLGYMYDPDLNRFAAAPEQ